MDNPCLLSGWTDRGDGNNEISLPLPKKSWASEREIAFFEAKSGRVPIWRLNLSEPCSTRHYGMCVSPTPNCLSAEFYSSWGELLGTQKTSCFVMRAGRARDFFCCLLLCLFPPHLLRFELLLRGSRDGGAGLGHARRDPLMRLGDTNLVAVVVVVVVVGHHPPPTYS